MIDARLLSCFQRAFPKLTDEQIRAASMRTVGSFDSAALFNLIVLVEQEFAASFDAQTINSLTSFAAFRAALERHPPAAATPSA